MTQPAKPAGKRTFPDARVFPVETRFQKLAKRPGGVSRDKAIERAEARIEEEVKPRFEDWLKGELEKLSSAIKAAERGEAAPGWVDTASFHCRELRDSAATLGFELLAFIANSFCDILDAIETEHKSNMESITCHMDALMLAGQKSYLPLRPDQVPELTSGLRRVVHVTLAPTGADEANS
jgi:hypothetical protein